MIQYKEKYEKILKLLRYRFIWPGAGRSLRVWNTRSAIWRKRNFLILNPWNGCGSCPGGVCAISRKAEPRVLCEALEITDESWRNAVEGYLNTQRFYLLVEPENFDIALGTCDLEGCAARKRHTVWDLLMPAGWNSMTKKPGRDAGVGGYIKESLMPDVLSIWFLKGTDVQPL